jgi:hypothetical protein
MLGEHLRFGGGARRVSPGLGVNHHIDLLLMAPESAALRGPAQNWLYRWGHDRVPLQKFVPSAQLNLVQYLRNMEMENEKDPTSRLWPAGFDRHG